jgi:hypothetical protein
MWVFNHRRDDGPYKVSVVKDIVFETLEEGDPIPENMPTFTFHRMDLQNLMDELWRNGVRPTEHGSEGQLAALENHLQDMRHLAFKGNAP